MVSRALRYAAPNVVSLLSMTVGLCSIILSGSGHLALAGWLVIYSCFLDKADGTIARALGVSSPFGVQMDSFSDFTSFGLAPAALMYFLAPIHGLPLVWAGAAAWCFPAMAAVRLARFNISGHEDRDFFLGIPTTFAAGLFAATVLSMEDLGILASAASLLPSIMFLLAALMVSPLRIPKLKSRKSKMLTFAQLAAVLCTLVLAVFRVLPEVPLVLGLLYLFGGILVGARSRHGDTCGAN